MNAANTEYNGWVNRETWATDLHLSNDEGLYSMVCELAGRCQSIYELEDAIKDFVEVELKDFAGFNAELTKIFDDIGSLWRIDWREIAESWRDEMKLDEIKFSEPGCPHCCCATATVEYADTRTSGYMYVCEDCGHEWD